MYGLVLHLGMHDHNQPIILYLNTQNLFWPILGGQYSYLHFTFDVIMLQICPKAFLFKSSENVLMMIIKPTQCHFRQQKT